MHTYIHTYVNDTWSIIFSYQCNTFIHTYIHTYIHTCITLHTYIPQPKLYLLIKKRAEPGSLDLDVRRWCHSRQVIYQPYASGRNLEQLSKRSLIPLLRDRAARKGVSTYAYALKFLLQTGNECLESDMQYVCMYGRT